MELPDSSVFALPLCTEKADATWRRRRPRRVAVRLLGSLLVAGAFWGAFQITNVPRAREAMLRWVTIDHVAEMGAVRARASAFATKHVCR